MIYVGIDVSKDKHDCFIQDAEGNVICKSFTIPNNKEGFDLLYSKAAPFKNEIKIGLEATGHYSYNLLGYLLDKGLPTYVINPLQTNLFRKSQTLRKTKTDKVDCKTIAALLVSSMDLQPYSLTSYHNEELKSLSRYRFDKVKERARLKAGVTRLVNILFPELEKLVPTLHMKSVYALLKEYPGAYKIATAHLTKLTNILAENSKGRYSKDKAVEIRNAARNSIGSVMPAKSLELSHTIALIDTLSAEIDEVEAAIKKIMNELDSPIVTIPGIKFRMGAIILSEIGDISRFKSADKLLAFSGISPSTYQSGKFTASFVHMEKRGSKYLRYALFNAAIYVCIWEPTFKAYLDKKRREGKHYYVAITHAVKKLVRLIFHLLKTGQKYVPQN